jgi:hypothetical protein
VVGVFAVKGDFWMKVALCTLMAAALAAQPVMSQAAEMPVVPAKPAKPAKPKVAGTRAAVGSGFDAETVELSLVIGGLVAAIAVGASRGGGHHDKDCHCHGGGGTGTTGTTH